MFVRLSQLPCCLRRVWPLHLILAALLFALPLAGHRMEGDLTIVVRDATGLPLPAQVELTSRVSLFRADAHCNAEGRARFKRIPLGVYRLQVSHQDFQAYSEQLRVPTELPVTRQITLDVADIETSLTILDSAPLLDRDQAGTIFRVGRGQLRENAFTTLGRSTINLVDSLPGWLLEANAVLHPRGSEYDTQYVIDGIPLLDNRSLAFAPGFETDEFEALNVMTATIPAEFGRKLGGVVELYTRRSGQPGHRPEFNLQGGSFNSTQGAFSDQYVRDKTSVALGLHAGHTERYLDPPSLENFTNTANSAGFNVRFERDLSDRDRAGLYLRSNRVNFMVPNDIEQQARGQRQDRRGAETLAQVHLQRTLSPRVLAVVRGMFRDVSSKLWSNTLSTPVFTQQDRGFREGVVTGSVTVETENHRLKFGSDLRRASIREQFLFSATEAIPEIEFLFRDRRQSTDVGAFMQDHFRFGDLVVDAGVRFDYYRLLVKDSAISPRVGAAYYWEPGELVIRGGYDRVFQTPAIENLLLSSSEQAQSLRGVEGGLPVPLSRADFFEIGLRKSVANMLRIEVNHFWRNLENFYDDDVFFNTGVSFPISFDRAEIEGTEVRIELPRYRQLSSFISYSNLLGRATSPVTGGLFIQGGEAEELRDVVTTFPISQDQRNSVSARFRFEPHARIWFAVGGRYGSGLPVELQDDETEAVDQEPGQDAGSNEGRSVIVPLAILDRVDFARGRVRPNFSLDLSLGVGLWQRDHRSLRLQVDVLNATDRLNLINFSGLFSGTAIAPPRTIGARLRMVL